MSAATVQFVEMVRLEHARIERLKQAADERGEIIENIIWAALPERKTWKQRYILEILSA